MQIEIYKSGVYKIVHINKFNQKWKGLGYVRIEKPIEPIVNKIEEAPSVIEPEKQLTEKEALQSKADELAIEYTKRTTVKELKELIAGATAPKEGE